MTKKTNKASIHLREDGSVQAWVGERAVNILRLKMILRGIQSEIRGMRLTNKAPTCYSIAKREFGLTGNRKKVLAKLTSIVDQIIARELDTRHDDCVKIVKED